MIVYLFVYKNHLIIVSIVIWGLGIGDWGLGIGPNPQSPIPNPPIPNPQAFYHIILCIYYNYSYIYISSRCIFIYKEYILL